MRLLKKEFRLCIHPTCYLMPWLSALVLAPNYPYAVSYFYVALSIFFVCLSAREDHDAAYTLSLPVSRREMVAGRMLLAFCVEMAQMILCALFLFIKRKIGAFEPNAAGLDANVAVLGEGFLVFGLFHAVFFPLLYQDINKVGKAFAISSVAMFLYIAVSIVLTYAVPFVRDTLDTPDPEHLTEKLIFTAVCAVFYVCMTLFAFRLSVKRFERVDLQL